MQQDISISYCKTNICVLVIIMKETEIKWEGGRRRRREKTRMEEG
jgi:hypothetical protein